MTYFFFCLGLLQCAVLWIIGRAGQTQITKAIVEKRQVDNAFIDWPSCALIIPVYGDNRIIEAAIRSLLLQDYPDYSVCLVMAKATDPAYALAERLKFDYTNLTYVVAGEARHCGQKNHNLLAALAEVGASAEIYAFCDSSHLAEADFLRSLVYPLAQGKTEFSTGYHEVFPGNKGLVTIAYALNVLFMRFLQGIHGLTQPWGGAMAMTRQAFERYGIANFWATNVVDDCSLGAFLQKHNLSITFCPAAILRTVADKYSGSIWSAWLKRQVLFLKFCFPGQWFGLCLFSFFMIIPFIWAAEGIIEGLFNFGPFSSPFMALCWFLLFMGEMTVWRKFLPIKITMWRCFLAFFISSVMLLMISIQTMFTNRIIWNNINYDVGEGGRVLSITLE